MGSTVPPGIILHVGRKFGRVGPTVPVGKNYQGGRPDCITSDELEYFNKIIIALYWVSLCHLTFVNGSHCTTGTIRPRYNGTLSSFFAEPSPRIDGIDEKGVQR